MAVKKIDPTYLKKLIDRLRKAYPNAECSLDFKSPFQLLTATILSAQCTDARVNKVTPALFAKFPDAPSMSKASQGELEELVRTTGFFRSKAKSLLEMSKDLTSKFKGQVPETMEELHALRGVGRKTANVVLGNAFGKPDGVVVDTHVKRISFRLGLTRNTDPVKVEKDLNEIVPQQYWADFPHWLILHGRAICKAPTPLCPRCFLKDICPKKGVNLKKVMKAAKAAV